MINTKYKVILFAVAVTLIGVLFGVSNYTKKAPVLVPKTDVGTSNLPPHTPSVPSKFPPSDVSEKITSVNTIGSDGMQVYQFKNNYYPFGFELTYPSDWSEMRFAGRSGSLGGVYTLPKSQLRGGVDTDMWFNLSVFSEPFVKRKAILLENGHLQVKKMIQLSNLQGVILDSKNDKGDWNEIEIHILDGGNVTFEIYFSKYFQGFPELRKNLPVLEKILLSFKSLKQ
ncbi:MAG: hypothetical protein AAB552_02800 [Patescibacteria group bacterium]